MDFIKNALNTFNPVAEYQPAFQRAIEARQAPTGRLNSAANVRLLMAEKARQARLLAEQNAAAAAARKKEMQARVDRFEADPTIRARDASQRARVRDAALKYDGQKEADMNVIGQHLSAGETARFINNLNDVVGIPVRAHEEENNVREYASRPDLDRKWLTSSFEPSGGRFFRSEQPASYHPGGMQSDTFYPTYSHLPNPFSLKAAPAKGIYAKAQRAIPQAANTLRNSFGQAVWGQ